MPSDVERAGRALDPTRAHEPERRPPRRRARVALRTIAAALALGLDLAAQNASADGGLVRLHERAGPFTVTLFSAPTPLCVGPADLSVLVQAGDGGVPLVDAKVELRLDPPRDAAASPIAVPATAERATNKLLYAARVELAAPGEWRATLSIEQGGGSATVNCPLPVSPAEPPLSALWPYLVAPVVAIAVFALHQRLARRDTVLTAR